ncbi:hypothetical protein ACFQ3N_11870 [Virgibacillus byunsanensis]|uniref:Uncharacterized protein n=1 Tax=Virgibacillus byunsanensis TaxID=570945 RepID=A0ABW3LMB2_9BACI
MGIKEGSKQGGKYMVYRRRLYIIKPEKLDEFNDFFHTYLYPNQIKHGSKLIGRWVNEIKMKL